MIHRRTSIFFVNSRDFTAIRLVTNDISEFYLEKNGDKYLLICKEFPGSNEESCFEIESSSEIVRLVNLNTQIWYDKGFIHWNEEPLEVHRSQIQMYKEARDIECPVCYENFKTNIGSLCGHTVCMECMVKMHKNNLKECPMCRSEDFKYPLRLAIGSTVIKL
jgi:hypothetical protein